MAREIYYSNFYTKLEVLEKCVSVKNFESYKLEQVKDSKLKMRVTFDEICRSIRRKLLFGCTISSFEFHSIIQIYHARIIPKECVLNAMETKLARLCAQLKDMSDLDIILSTGIRHPNINHFRLGLSMLCCKFRIRSNKLVDTHPDSMDIIVFVSEKTVTGEEISLQFYDKIDQLFGVFKINQTTNNGFVFRF